MVFLWFSYGFPMVFLWLPHVSRSHPNALHPVSAREAPPGAELAGSTELVAQTLQALAVPGLENGDRS